MHDLVQNYYGQQLTNSRDLKTSACCDISQVPEWLKPLLARVHPAVEERYYGCGLVCPSDLTGLRVLDLGCGAGRDVFVLSQLVGEGGQVVGVDMTPEQLAVARDYHPFHAEQFGFDNVTFLQGYIEQLDQLGLEPASFDLVVSNCVVNLSPDKTRVLEGVARLLKPGGELYFSDVYCDRRLPEALRQDPVLYGECLGGALYWNDFIRLAKRAGFNDPRLVEDRPLEITDPTLAERLGEHRFYSATYRLFNLPLEDACEDYGALRAHATRLGLGFDGPIRHDKHLSAIASLLDPTQYDLVSKPGTGLVVIQGGAGTSSSNPSTSPTSTTNMPPYVASHGG